MLERRERVVSAPDNPGILSRGTPSLGLGALLGATAALQLLAPYASAIQCESAAVCGGRPSDARPGPTSNPHGA